MTAKQTARDRYAAYILSPQWADQRKQAFNRWGRFCNACGKNEAIHVHHLFYRNLYDCIPEDLMPLCERCHDVLHSMDTMPYSVSKVGNHFEKRRLTVLLCREVPKNVDPPPPPPPPQEPKTIIKTVTVVKRVVEKVQVYVPVDQAKVSHEVVSQLLKKQDDRRAANIARRAKKSAIEKAHRIAANELREKIHRRAKLARRAGHCFGKPCEFFVAWEEPELNAIISRSATPLFVRPNPPKPARRTIAYEDRC